MVDFLSPLNSPDSSRQRVHRLQILVFLVSNHWDQLHQELHSTLFSALQQLLSDDDHDVRSWAFCCSAAIAASTTASMPLNSNNSRKEGTFRTSQKSSKLPTTPDGNAWEFVWLSALRNFSNRLVCRAATHTAVCIMSPGNVPGMSLTTSLASLISRDLIRQSVSGLVDDLTVQGPAFPSDSVCAFLEACLTFAKTDAQLFQAGIPSKLFAWLSTVWKPDARKARIVKGEWEDPVAIFRLLCSITIPNAQELPSDAWSLEMSPPQCDIVNAVVEDLPATRARAFLYKARLDVGQDRCEPRSADAPAQAAASSVKSSADPTLAQNATTFLQQALDGLLEDEQDNPLASHTFEALHRASKLLAVSMLFFGCLRSRRPQAQRSLTRTASQLLALLLPHIGSSRWTTTEKLSLFAPIGLLFPSVSTAKDASPLEGLIYPGSTANVFRSLLRQPEPHEVHSVANEILAQIWSCDDLRTLLHPESGSFTLFLHHMAVNAWLVNPPDETNVASDAKQNYPATQGTIAQGQKASQAALSQFDMDSVDSHDGFGSVRDAAPASLKRKISGGSLRQGAKSVAASRVSLSPPHFSASILTLTSLRGLLAVEMCEPTTSPRILTAKHLFSLLLQSQGDTFLSLLDGLLEMIVTGTITPSLEDVDSLFEVIGSLFLPSYEHARSPRVYSLTVRLLSATVEQWVAASHSGHEEQASNARRLCSWLTSVQHQSRLTAWSVRLDLVVFLDKFTRCDPREELWGDEDLLHTEDGLPIVPTKLIPEMIKDPDFRVR